MDGHIIPFRIQPPQEVEVLYVMWHASSGQMPAKHLYHKDSIWAWIPDRRMRQGPMTKARQAVRKKWGYDHYYRPPRGKEATPIRIFGGKKWKWYWLYQSYKTMP